MGVTILFQSFEDKSTLPCFPPESTQLCLKVDMIVLFFFLTILAGVSNEAYAVWNKKTVLPLQDPVNLCLDLSSLASRISVHADENNNTDGIPDDIILMHQHPSLRKTEGLMYSPIHEGEIVFFPAYWYHYIHNVDLSVSVTTQTFNKSER
jgi:hypothetical protein